MSGFESAPPGAVDEAAGATEVPMGVVGPLHLRGEEVTGEVYVPLATTEAALVASTNRGCRAIGAAGGARVRAERGGLVSSPVFRTSGQEEASSFVAWLSAHRDELARACAEAGLRLEAVDADRVGTTVLVCFRYEPSDGAGRREARDACRRAVREVVEPGAGVKCVALSGNHGTAGKPAPGAVRAAGGWRVHAEVEVGPAVLRERLKTTAEKLSELQYRKNLLGSISAGARGFNAHYANMVAAFCLATGQDAAGVVEGSLGITCVEAGGREGVYVSVDLPAVPLRAAGGATELATAGEALRLLGVRPEPERPGAASRRLAEILGGVVLAGEVSLMSAFTSHDLAGAHQRLGRRNVENGGRSGETGGPAANRP